MPIELHTDIKEVANEGVRMVLRHPVTGADFEDEAGNKAALIVLGKDAKVARKLDREFQKRVSDHSRKNRSRDIPPEMWEQHELDKAVATTVGWEHCSHKGQEAFSAELIRQFYLEEPWALEQWREWHDDRAHFSRASTTT